uniref:Uncharacterized protein n=1 Tax=Lepeophtheirus salmonis TaxID=72036 RepID=A0A0K2VAR5_LEPSM
MARSWSKDIRDRISPDLCPLDFFLSNLERETNSTSHTNEDSLTSSIVALWDNLSDEFVINSCMTFWQRVKAVTDNEGVHIEGKKFCKNHVYMF